jgi:hypothetical protein
MEEYTTVQCFSKGRALSYYLTSKIPNTTSKKGSGSANCKRNLSGEGEPQKTGNKH